MNRWEFFIFGFVIGWAFGLVTVVLVAWSY